MNDLKPDLLDVRNLTVRYGDAVAIADVSLTVRKGEIVSVVGGNGAGKTTLIRTLAGMLRPAAGSIHYAGAAISGLASDRVAELGIGHVPEGRQVFGPMTVQENLELGAITRRARPGRRERLQRIFSMFPILAERRKQEARTLSGGEQQQLAIGRCLMADPEFILFDEPSLGLSPVMVDFMFDTIRNLNKAGLTILLVEQNVTESLELCSRAYVLESGEVVMSGTGADLISSPRIREAYLGL